MKSVENTVSNVVIALYGDRWWLYLHHGESCIVYRPVESPCCTPEMDITLHVSCTSMIHFLKWVHLIDSLHIFVQFKSLNYRTFLLLGYIIT